MSALGVPNVVLDAEPKPSHARQPLAHRDAAFHEEATDLIDHPGPLTDQAGTDPMQRQKVHLLGRLDANEAHRRPLHRFDNRLGIPAIDLVALDLWPLRNGLAYCAGISRTSWPSASNRRPI